MKMEEFESLSELEILKRTLLKDLIEACNFVLKAGEEGRVDEKETVDKVCKNILVLCEEISTMEKDPKEGLEEILLELDAIRKLVEEAKMDPRSLVADKHLIMEARIKDQLQ